MQSNLVLHVLYISTASPFLSVPALDDLIAKSRVRNAALDVTGLLLHRDGSYVQALEGAPNSVNDLLASIQADPRHREMREIVRYENDVRDFPQWYMGCEQMQDRREGRLDLDGQRLPKSSAATR